MGFGEHYTAEENEWLRENYCKIGKKHICEKFNSHFSSNRRPESMWSHIRRMGITGSEEFRKRRCKESFGMDLGSEHETKSGYVVVKTKEINGGRSRNWELKQRVVWKQHNGDIPKGFDVVFLNGNKLDCRIENLVLIPNKYLSTMINKGWISEDRQLTEAGVTWCRLNNLVGCDYGLRYKDQTMLIC